MAVGSAVITLGVCCLFLASALCCADSVERLVAGNTAFAVDLYHALSAEDGNVFFSPYSISEALAMAYAGAAGETEDQMADVLHFTLWPEELHMAFQALRAYLMSQDRFLENPESDAFSLNVANSLWGQQDHGFLESYNGLLRTRYGAELREVDYRADPEAARQLINEWVSDQTREKILELLPEGSIGSETLLVLANAVYYNAAWESPFEERDTQDRPFFLIGGEATIVSMMRQATRFAHASTDGFQAIQLRYANCAMAMMIVLPDEGSFHAVESQFDADVLEVVIASLQSDLVRLTMPRFSYRSTFSLGEMLAGMGMPDAFSLDADFSGMDGTRDISIGGVIHEAFVDVNEQGTEAAAATAIACGTGGPGVEPEIVDFTIDRPFLFFIRDTETGTILFMGRVLDPS